MAASVTNAGLQETYRSNALFDSHVDDPEFGYRFLHEEAHHVARVSMWALTAWRICRDNRWWSAFGKKKGKNGKRPGPPAHDNLVQRVFTADNLDELWLTDIPPQVGGAPTEHSTAEGKLYLGAVKEPCSGRIVGYSIDPRMRARLAVNAIDNAVARRGDVVGCIVHSDRGSRRIQLVVATP